MTEEQKKKCHVIIHSMAAAAATGNAVPVPGLGVAVDTITMATMAMSLASILGGSITQEVAKGMAVTALKETMLKQPIKVLTKELSKLIPVLGQVVSPSVSVVIIEAAGWALANDMDKKINK